eukprot:NODE_11977_length_1254_cov_2.219166.p1 GENE.NODE_11977_length_1254_cov_2.219166~~NODE_11977_length_1254_cov_2.219166.p1  ORF type:complete len:370 (-),score=91.48 NODE_11977_length_1254_cov_2.219166:61-1170(-)
MRRASDLCAADALGQNLSAWSKVFWYGRHRHWGWANPLGKLPRHALAILEEEGWRRVDEDDARVVPVFYWATRRASDFPSSPRTLPRVRPFPQAFTQHLNDKAAIARHLTTAKQAHIHPLTLAVEDFLEVSASLEPNGAAEEEGQLWFLKHRWGVQGKAVYPFMGARAVVRRLEEMSPASWHDFIVQRAVTPPALRDGRKWALRVHALLHGTADGALRLYCHRAMITLPHGCLYTPCADHRAAHISSACKSHELPPPFLCEDADVVAQVMDLTARAFAAVWCLAPHAPPNSELCQVFGLDFVADASGRVWLIEVNDYPAIGNGTMSHVAPVIYANLVRDVLRLVVLPCVDGTARTPGDFVLLDEVQQHR